MSAPRNGTMQPCPRCNTDEHLAVYKYDHGGQHVECDNCFYLGPCEGSRRQAIKSHNDGCDTARLAGAQP